MANQYRDLPVIGGTGGVTSLNSLVGALTLVAGSGITITPAGSNITIAATGEGALTFADSIVNNSGTVTLVNDSASPAASNYYGTNSSGTLGYFSLPSPSTGTVTSVALTAPSILSVSGSPITTSGTLALTLATQSANTVFAGPTTGAAAAPTFRALVAADLPAGTGTVTSIMAGTGLSGGTITTSGTIAIANTAVTPASYGDGTHVATFTVNQQGQLTAAASVAITGAAPTGAAGGDLGGTYPNPTVVSVADVITGTLGVANGGTGTGTAFTAGSVVFAGASGVYSQNNAHFFWDNTNFRLGLGTAVPGAVLDLAGTVPQSSTTSVLGALLKSRASTLTDSTGSGTIGHRVANSFGIPTFASTTNAETITTAATVYIDGAPAAGANTTITNSYALQVNAGNVSLGGNLTVNGTILTTGITDTGLTASLPVFTDGGQNLVTESITTARSSLGIGSGFSFIVAGTSYTTPATITTATLFKFTMIGGGGGGAGTTTTSLDRGSGGGAGGTGILWLTGLTPSTSYTIAIGAGGAAGNGGTGGNAGNTTLTVGGTTYTASGGIGGPGGVVTQGGAGGATTNMTIEIPGQPGGGIGSAGSVAISGAGGSTMYCAGGAGVPVPASGNTPGNNGGSNLIAYGGGGGGGGGASGATSTSQGGIGVNGMILVEYTN